MYRTEILEGLNSYTVSRSEIDNSKNSLSLSLKKGGGIKINSKKILA